MSTLPIAKVEGKTKGEMQTLLTSFSCHEVRKTIQEVIKEKRGCSLKDAKDIKRLTPSEVQAVLERYT